MKETPRELTLNILSAITEENAFSHLLIRDVLNKYNYWESRDKDFLKRLTEGTLERMLQIDFIIAQFSTVPVARMKPLIRNLLRMSVYQIIYMEGIPDSAACNEAVKLAAKRGFHNLRGFVNGILRNISREKEHLKWPEREQEPLRFLSVYYSMPEWLVEKWLRELGPEQTESLLAGLLQIRPVTVRLRGDITAVRRERWLTELKEQGVRAENHLWLPYAYDLYQTGGVQNLPGFAEGLFMVQDASSMLAVEAAGLKGHESVLDVCAAPGGKALFAAERAARVQARDLSRVKTDLLRANGDRMGAANLEISEYDARVPDETLREAADVLFADLPCSGLGVIGRKRDIKYKITPESIAAVVNLQREILAAVWQYVKPGGIMIYSTCTINQAENEDMMAWFTTHFPFEREAFPATKITFPGGPNGSLQLLPGTHPTDGFYICRLRRKKEA